MFHVVHVLSAKEQDVVIHQRAVQLLETGRVKRRAEVQSMDLGAEGGAKARECERLVRHDSIVCGFWESGKSAEATAAVGPAVLVRRF